MGTQSMKVPSRDSTLLHLPFPGCPARGTLREATAVAKLLGVGNAEVLGIRE